MSNVSIEHFAQRSDLNRTFGPPGRRYNALALAVVLSVRMFGQECPKFVTKSSSLYYDMLR